MAKQFASITTLPRSPEDDRRARMIRYVVTMVIRLVCLALCLVVQGWWLLVCAAGAIFLPYVAVIFANAIDSTESKVERPDSARPMIESLAPESPASKSPASEPTGDSDEVPKP